MKTLIFLVLLTTSALAQSGWQPPRSLLISRPEDQAEAAKRLHLPQNCIILLATLDCSDCKKPLEVLRGKKDAVILIRARATSVERWKAQKPTAARIITISTDEDDQNWFGMGAFAMPTVIRWQQGRSTGEADHVPAN